MLSIISIREIKTLVRYRNTFTKIYVIQKDMGYKMLLQLQSDWKLYALLMKMEDIQPFWKITWWFPRKWNK
jgi:hypothetical protein